MIKPRPVPVSSPRAVSIFGATGTIGQNTLKLIAASPEKFRVSVLTARQNAESLIGAAKNVRPDAVVIEDEAQYTTVKSALSGLNIDVSAGKQALVDAARRDADVMISGIVGAAALPPTLAAIRNGTTIGLANKECLVCAGSLLMEEARKSGARIIPVDSEHNALFQIFDFDRAEQVESITLTASGGPFRTYTAKQMQQVTPEQATQHPNWNMGAKITVDSATMMNKGLEIIEAYHLFPVNTDQIEVVVHPESVIHGLVQYQDGSVLAGMSLPDMRVPIAYALEYPDRLATELPRLSLAELGALHFEAPDPARFPALTLARRSLESGGIVPSVLNAANEIAVAAFLEKRITFPDIVRCVELTLDRTPPDVLNDLEQVFAVDQNARTMAENIIKTL